MHTYVHTYTYIHIHTYLQTYHTQRHIHDTGTHTHMTHTHTHDTHTHVSVCRVCVCRICVCLSYLSNLCPAAGWLALSGVGKLLRATVAQAHSNARTALHACARHHTRTHALHQARNSTSFGMLIMQIKTNSGGAAIGYMGPYNPRHLTMGLAS